MVESNDMHFLRSNRKLTYVQQDIVYEMSTLNLGPVKAFNIRRTKYGGFKEVGATVDDCKNFKQSLTCFIGEYDAEMVVQRYNMVFVPFTTIDNRCRNVTVGAGLLSFDPIESYSWILKVFLDSFGISPKTDAISQSEFETQWELIMKEYDPETNKGLSDMFEMRYDWIPTYYMDEPHSDHCMEIQRHNGRKNDHDTRYTHPSLVSENPFEKETEMMYTKAIVNDFQDEMFHIRSGVACLKSTEKEDFVRFSVFDFNAYVLGCLKGKMK
ncbi:protein FAR1-RELATED SEQUENCE 5-like [Bidens hawaiensis]|uniref:protein FAR1-RELATED SEQUENCE 5-like n=1 Tax=Bidens hawaiensis TaxID=980011 RepID=UPI00404A0227